MTKEFEIKSIDADHGPAISIRQIEGIGYDFFTGVPVINPIILTPFEAELLIKELTAITKSVRNVHNSKVRV